MLRFALFKKQHNMLFLCHEKPYLRSLHSSSAMYNTTFTSALLLLPPSLYHAAHAAATMALALLAWHAPLYNFLYSHQLPLLSLSLSLLFNIAYVLLHVGQVGLVCEQL